MPLRWDLPGLITVHEVLATGIHGVGSGSIVGTGLEQTLAAKTLTAPIINGIVTTTGLTLPAFTLGGKLTAGAVEIEGSVFDIDGGDISAVTISGGLTWSAAQNLNSQALTNVNIDSGTIDGVTITSPTLQGTVAAGTGLTMPAMTLAGAIGGGDQSWTNVGDMTFAAGSILASGGTNGNTLLLRANDTTFITLTTGATDAMTLGPFTLTGVATAGGATLIAATPGAHTAVTAESIDYSFLAHTITITGAIATQRFALFAQPTITAASGLTVTSAGTVVIADAPVAAGSAVITNPYALWVQAGTTYLAGAVKLGSTLALGGNITGNYAWTTSGSFNIGSIEGYATGAYLQPSDSDGRNWIFKARDTGVSEVRVGCLQGAADPYMEVGSPSLGSLRGYYSGIVAFDYAGVECPQIIIAKVTVAYNGTLFNAVGLTNSAVVWAQPANTIVLAAKMRMTTQFAAASMTDLDVTVGLDADHDGLLAPASMNMTSATAGAEFSGPGAYFGTNTLASVAGQNWTAYSTAVGANLSTLSAGSLDFYFTYLQL